MLARQTGCWRMPGRAPLPRKTVVCRRSSSCLGGRKSKWGSGNFDCRRGLKGADSRRRIYSDHPQFQRSTAVVPAAPSPKGARRQLCTSRHVSSATTRQLRKWRSGNALVRARCPHVACAPVPVADDTRGMCGRYARDSHACGWCRQPHDHSCRTLCTQVSVHSVLRQGTMIHKDR